MPGFWTSIRVFDLFSYWPCDGIYRLALDITTPVSPSMAMADNQCVSEKQKIDRSAKQARDRHFPGSFRVCLNQTLLIHTPTRRTKIFVTQKDFCGPCLLRVVETHWHGSSSWQLDHSQGGIVFVCVYRAIVKVKLHKKSKQTWRYVFKNVKKQGALRVMRFFT